MIKICAGTKRLSSDPEDQPLLGDASAEFKVFLPKEKCQATTGKVLFVHILMMDGDTHIDHVINLRDSR